MASWLRRPHLIRKYCRYIVKYNRIQRRCAQLCYVSQFILVSSCIILVSESFTFAFLSCPFALVPDTWNSRLAHTLHWARISRFMLVLCCTSFFCLRLLAHISLGIRVLCASCVPVLHFALVRLTHHAAVSPFAFMPHSSRSCLTLRIHASHFIFPSRSSVVRVFCT